MIGGAHPRVLVVDDNEINRRLLRAVLESEGMTVIEAADGERGLAALGERAVDVVVTDILMPRMDGYRFCYEARMAKQLNAPPFVFYTATYTSPDDEKLARELGAVAFLRKPVPPANVVKAVQQAAGRPAGKDERPFTSPQELMLMKEYSERLVSRLEAHNIALERAQEELRAANQLLEERVRQRTAELERQANRQLEDFVHFVSHELRAPVRSVSGFAEMLRERCGSDLPPEARRWLQTIEKRSGQMDRLISELLHFSRVGQQELRSERVDMAALVQRAIEETRPQREGRRVEFSVGALPGCTGDATLLYQVVLNLVDNAIKFSRKREVALIEIDGTRAEGVCTYRVSDNGAGFDPKWAEQVFGVFQRVHRAEEFEGTGVGLGLVKNIIQRHGGTVRAEAAKDRGATFYFTVREELNAREGAK